MVARPVSTLSFFCSLKRNTNLLMSKYCRFYYRDFRYLTIRGFLKTISKHMDFCIMQILAVLANLCLRISLFSNAHYDEVLQSRSFG